MATAKPIDRILPLMREFGALERKRVADGVTPAEYQRWLELQQQLASQLPGGRPPGAERRRHPRVPTRMLVSFRSRDQLRDAMITSISRGGLFIATAACLPIGEQFTLSIRVDASGEHVEVPCEVVSSRVGPRLTAGAQGMGVKFGALSPEQRQAVDRLFSVALGDHFDEDLSR